MDPVPATIAVAVAVALVTTIGVLWRRIDRNEKASAGRETRCNEQNAALGTEIKQTKDKLIELLKDRAEDAEQRAEERARRELVVADALKAATKVLNRFEPEEQGGSGGTSALQRTIRGSLILVAILALCGCARDRAVANSAATIWEAADATERGADPAQTMPAIKANAAAIIRSTGSTYSPAGVTP